MERRYLGNIKLNKNLGFTMMEVIVVSVLICLLAAFAVPKYQNAIIRAKCRKLRLNLISIHGAIYNYIARYKSFPTQTQYVNDILPPLEEKLDLERDYFNWTSSNFNINSFAIQVSLTAKGKTADITLDQNAISPSNPSCSGALCSIVGF